MIYWSNYQYHVEEPLLDPEDELYELVKKDIEREMQEYKTQCEWEEV